MLVLISKVNVDTHGIYLLEVFCKMVEAVIYIRIYSVVPFHGILHVFFAGKGASNAIMELKISQELVNVDQDPLFLVFLDLRKVYKNLDQGKLLQTLAGYGEG